MRHHPDCTLAHPADDPLCIDSRGIAVSPDPTGPADMGPLGPGTLPVETAADRRRILADARVASDYTGTGCVGAACDGCRYCDR